MGVTVSGATGFVGTAILGELRRAGIDARPLTRSEFDLRGEFDNSILDGTSTLVHCAYDFNAPPDINVLGTQRLLEAARAKNVRVVFISSFAAVPNARSGYGSAKLRIESLAHAGHDAVVRPGLVVGSGGLFGRIVEHMRTSVPIPLIGDPRLQTIYIDDLANAVTKIVARSMHGTFNVAECEAVPMIDMYAEIARHLAVYPRYLRVPANLALALTRASNALRIRLPIDEDRILGLLEMQVRETRPDTDRLGIKVRRMSQSVAALLAPGSA